MTNTRAYPRLLLINPRFPESFWSFRWAFERIMPGKKVLNPPLGLATLAALCPPNWEIEIVDENIEPIPLTPPVDVIGICGMAVQFRRQQELLSFYRKRGYYVVAGGSYASLCPEHYEEVVDTVVVGEAEYIWPQFCRDFVIGKPRKFYQETGLVDLVDSPTPRFELLKLGQYQTASMQFSRGCPYRCDFCDIIVMFGRRPRTKSLQQIGKELDRLRSLGVSRVFFVDDNLIGHKAKAKALLAYIADYQRRHNDLFRFGTEASLNLAEDDELLQLYRQANFTWVFIGIESPDEASLKETNKTQNTRQDILSAVRTLYRHGINVLAGFIVGFDNDTLDTFDRQYRFIKASGIQVAMIGLLTALPRTPLYERLKQEGRLRLGAEPFDNTRAGTNLLPRGMKYDAMVAAYKGLYHRLLLDRNIADRIHNKTRYLKTSSETDAFSFKERVGIVTRFFTRGLLPGGPRRWYHFLRTLAKSVPRTWPLAINDWTVGLAMRDYVDRHFDPNPLKERGVVETTLASIRDQCAASLHQGALEVSLSPFETGAQLSVTLRGLVDVSFFTQGTRRLEQMLRRSAATLTLPIEELSATQRSHLDNMLTRLARYGDRVSIRVSEKLLPMLAIDSSVFNLILDQNVFQSRHKPEANVLEGLG